MTLEVARRSRSAATLMWTCIALFATRVVGQFEAFTLAPDWLPPMAAWYSGLLPYYLLLPAQIALLMIMSVVAWNRRVRTGRFSAANPRAAATLRMLAVAYFVFMAGRLALNLIDNGAEFWRAGAIPVAFHWVLALFMLVSGREAPPSIHAFWIPAEYGDEYGEADNVAHGDVPAMAQPLAYGLGLREEVRYGHTR
jgi:hypothetical protein